MEQMPVDNGANEQGTADEAILKQLETWLESEEALELIRKALADSDMLAARIQREAQIIPERDIRSRASRK